MSTMSLLLSVALVLGCSSVVSAEEFLKVENKTLVQQQRDADIRVAMSAVMGCGGGDPTAQLATIERSLQSLWEVLPKNRYDRVEWRMLRYLSHRYFMQQSSLLVRGLEPARRLNQSDLGAVEIIGEHAPFFAQAMLEGKQQASGYSLSDAAAMIATLEQLMFNSEIQTLEIVYAQHGKDTRKLIKTDETLQIMEEYMVNWMLDENPRSIHRVMRNISILKEIVPRWSDISSFVKGVVKGKQFQRQQAPAVGDATAIFHGLHSFENTYQVLATITRTFATFWEAECQSIKQSLVKMDRTGTGRVSLADFYGANVDGEWRFGESEAYLRELGALDESSAWRGKQVMISNYLQGASNCIVTKPHYLVCCINECEPILGDIEKAVQAPVAAPEEIIGLVSNMMSLNDEPPKIDRALTTQLQRIADIHGGQVPLHGRLFAQWLHYVFPHECPFPHKAGAVSSKSIVEFGNESYADADEIESQAASRHQKKMETMENVEEAQWMGQWSEEEELHADYDAHIRRGSWLARGTLALLVLGGVGLFAWRRLAIAGEPSKSSAMIGLGLEVVPSLKPHLV